MPWELTANRSSESRPAPPRAVAQGGTKPVTHTTVVGWDGSENAQTALAWACDRSPSDRIVLVHARGDSDPGAGHNRLYEQAESVRETHPGLRITCEELPGEASQVLADMTGLGTLVVLGAARSGSTSTATLPMAVVERAHGPVAVIPALRDGSRTGVAVWFDGTPMSRSALSFAAGEAAGAGEPLTIIDVRRPLADAPAVHGGHEENGDQDPAQWRVLHDALVTAHVTHPGLAVRRMAAKGGLASALLEASRTARLVVTGSSTEDSRAGADLDPAGRALRELSGCAVVVVPEA